MLRLLLALPLLLFATSALPVVALRWLPPPTSSFMLQRQLAGPPARQCARIHQRWVPWQRISPYVALAVVAAEDQRFAEHAGFDLDSIGRSLEQRRDGSRLRGASTISQQVAKNLFLWPGRSWLRKGLEAYLTVWIEAAWPKRRILEVYLNVAQLGDCTFGVEAAAGRFFGKPAAALGPHEAALLAAVLPNPTRLRVDQPSAYVRERAARVREQSARLGRAYLERL